MKDWIERVKNKPWVAHLLRAVVRFLARLGIQLGAAITYFSVVSLVPILLFSFAALGFFLTVLRPDLVGPIVDTFSNTLGTLDEKTRNELVALTRDTLGNWRGVGITALLIAIYTGAGWMGSLKESVRAQLRPDFDVTEQDNPVKVVLVNLVLLVGLLVLIVITFGLASVSTALADNIVGWLGLSEIGWLSPLLRVVPIVFSIGAGWVLFMYLFAVLPEDRGPWPVVRRGALLGAIGLAVLQYSTGLLFSLFSQNRAVAIFGPVIVLMLFFNLFAQLILFIAAWIATADQEAVPQPEEKVRFALTPGAGGEIEVQPPPGMVSQPVAARSVQVGRGAGYVTGAATGVGLGAALAWLVTKMTHGRR